MERFNGFGGFAAFVLIFANFADGLNGKTAVDADSFASNVLGELEAPSTADVSSFDEVVLL